MDTAANILSHRIEIGLGPTDNLQDFLRPFPQKHPFRSQGNGTVAAKEKLLSEFLLQILKLP